MLSVDQIEISLNRFAEGEKKNEYMNKNKMYKS